LCFGPRRPKSPFLSDNQGFATHSLDTDTSNLVKNANIPLRAAVLAEPPPRSISTRHTGRKNRASRRRTAHSISAAGGLRCSLTSPMYSLKGEGSFDGFGRCWGYFRLCSFHTPICTPISLSQGQRSLANGAVCPRTAAMNSEKQERAMSGE
jgi:hypothetical protein